MLTSRPVILGLIYAMVIEVGLGQIPTQVSRLSLTHLVKAMLRAPISAAETMPSVGPVATCAILIAFSAACVALAAVLFSWREFAGAGEK